jgi:hypothetical protein
MARADPEELLEAIEDNWARLWSLLDDVAVTEQSRSWSLKDVYAHLARWSDATSGAIRAHADDRSTAEFDRYFDDYRKWNAIWAEEDRTIEMPTAKESAKAAHGRLVQAFRSLNREEWDSYVVSLAEDVRDHYQAHLDDPLKFETTS